MNQEQVQQIINTALPGAVNRFHRGYEQKDPSIEVVSEPRSILRITWRDSEQSYLHIEALQIKPEQTKEIEGPLYYQGSKGIEPIIAYFNYRLTTKSIYKGDIPFIGDSQELDIPFITSILKNYQSFLD